jgi:hypothetical protein
MMEFVAGQHVVWSYRPQQWRRRVVLVDVEIAQTGSRRLRIRTRTATGQRVVRWVHAKNLRPKDSDEPAYPFPEPGT